MARTLEAMKALLVSEEEAARHLFVVCGQPSNRDDFLVAWDKEDPKWFDEWAALKVLIREIENE